MMREEEQVMILMDGGEDERAGGVGGGTVDGGNGRGCWSDKESPSDSNKDVRGTRKTTVLMIKHNH